MDENEKRKCALQVCYMDLGRPRHCTDLHTVTYARRQKHVDLKPGSEQSDSLL